MDNKNKKLMIVFEGPDMCGKSTQLDMAYIRLKQEGVRVAKWKFPDYTGRYGQDILNHLKNFNINKISAKRAERELDENSMNMMENKIQALNGASKYNPITSILHDEPYSSADAIICDRFTASQFVYDLAWIPLLCKKHLLPFTHKKHYIEFAKTILNHVYAVIAEYDRYFDVEFIYYDRSEFIRNRMNLMNPDRRIDEYDSNTHYQRVVADLFSTLELQITASGDMDYSVARETLRTYHPQIREAVYFGDSLIYDIMRDISKDTMQAYRYMTIMRYFAPRGLCRVIDPDMGFIIQNMGSVITNMPESSNSREARVENSKQYTHMNTMLAIADIFSNYKSIFCNYDEICKSLVNKQSYSIPDAMKGE